MVRVVQARRVSIRSVPCSEQAKSGQDRFTGFCKDSGILTEERRSVDGSVNDWTDVLEGAAIEVGELDVTSRLVDERNVRQGQDAIAARPGRAGRLNTQEPKIVGISQYDAAYGADAKAKRVEHGEADDRAESGVATVLDTPGERRCCRHGCGCLVHHTLQHAGQHRTSSTIAPNRALEARYCRNSRLSVIADSRPEDLTVQGGALSENGDGFASPAPA